MYTVSELSITGVSYADKHAVGTQHHRAPLCSSPVPEEAPLVGSSSLLMKSVRYGYLGEMNAVVGNGGGTRQEFQGGGGKADSVL